MKGKLQEKGQALILIALAAIGLFAFAALAIDGSRAFSDKRHAQNAVDTAALAGGLAHVRGNDITKAALDRAASNGYDNGASNDVTVTIADTPPGECPGAGKDITVTIVSHLPTTFAGVFGRSEITNAVTSTTRSCDTATVNPSPLYPGVAFMTTKTGPCNGGANPGLKSVGGSQIQLWGISIGSASTDGSCIQLGSGNAQLKRQESGTACSNLLTAAANGTGINRSSVHGQDGCGATQTSLSFPAAPANLGITCTGDATRSGNTLSPGNYYPTNFGNVDFPGGATNLNPGTYCVKTGNFKLNGTALRGNGVTIVLETGSLSWGGNGTKPDLSGPTSGPYKGLVIYAPPGNTSSMIFGTHGADERLRGTIMMQDASCDIGGQIQKNSYQFICSQLVLNSSATDVQVTYDSNTLYSPATVVKPTISLLR
ncbi:MAG: hypothetical protein EHM40_01515 [Chloroflexi bacterium]|nr:MAG: hypothetical protein EHM40_15970 [Chloroflexota bacterium]RPI96398.1 MAG: hypothetical protein EHM40_01515 [Chloroflexota bacterium]